MLDVRTLLFKASFPLIYTCLAPPALFTGLSLLRLFSKRGALCFILSLNFPSTLDGSMVDLLSSLFSFDFFSCSRFMRLKKPSSASELCCYMYLWCFFFKNASLVMKKHLFRCFEYLSTIFSSFMMSAAQLCFSSSLSMVETI